MQCDGKCIILVCLYLGVRGNVWIEAWKIKYSRLVIHGLRVDMVVYQTGMKERMLKVMNGI